MVPRHSSKASETDTETKPIDRVLACISNKPYAKGYLAHCPAHRDAEESLTIWEDQADEHVGIKCYAGCSRKAVVEAVGLTEQDLYRQDRPRVLHTTEGGITLLDLAVDKRIHPVQLINLGLLDMKYGRRDAVRIPYYLPDGSEYSRYRIRTALKASKGSSWSKGDAPLIPYGLHRLEEARAAGYLILVEGESDCWTLWNYGYPALGIPSATMYRCLQAEYFTDIPRLFVLQEPDGAGTALPDHVRKHLTQLGYPGAIYTLNLKAGADAEDPNALHQRELDTERFKATFQRCLDQAQDLALSPPDTGSDATEQSSPDLPEIMVNNVQLRDLVNAAVAAIGISEKDKPSLFMQASRLVRIGRDEKHRPVIVQMGVAEIKEVLTHVANFYRLKKSTGGEDMYEKVSVSPPKEVAEQILARATQKPYLPFPSLDTIVETPVLRPDGSILDTPGYDKKTRLYYAQTQGMDACRVPDDPTEAQRDAALALIWKAFGEFPYASLADRANALALLLTPMVRPAIPRHVPMALADAPKRGTGKGLLCDGITIIAGGDTAPILTMSDNGDELQKSITALLMEGATIIVIDNIIERLQSKHLDAVLTSDTWRSRILGVSKMTKVPQRATWIATGNNIRLGGDLPRRCYRIRLDAHMSRPDKRKDFTIRDLATWIKEHRVELVGALLTLARAWYVAGCPQDDELPAMATFTGWVKIVGGILKYAGVPGFLANLDELQEQDDEESAQWESFLLAWRVRFGEEWITAADICDTLTQTDVLVRVEDDLVRVEKENTPDSLVDALPEALQVAFKEKPATFKVRLGKALEKRIDACFGKENLRLEKAKAPRGNKTLWRVNCQMVRVVRVESNETENKNSEVHLPVNEQKNDSENSGINPNHPNQKHNHTEDQKMPNGLTCGSSDSCHEEDTSKTGKMGQIPDSTLTKSPTTLTTGEREVFTL
jgi:hypothetical protein